MLPLIQFVQQVSIYYYQFIPENQFRYSERRTVFHRDACVVGHLIFGSKHIHFSGDLAIAVAEQNQSFGTSLLFTDAPRTADMNRMIAVNADQYHQLTKTCSQVGVSQMVAVTCSFVFISLFMSTAVSHHLHHQNSHH